MFSSAEELAKNIIKIQDYIMTNSELSINYSCWLHIHVGIPESFIYDLACLKNILSYTYPNSKEIRDYTDICPPRVHPQMTAEQRKRRNLTRTSVMTEFEFQQAMQSRNLKSFWKEFDRKRHLVNLRSLTEHGTIEFRTYYMSFEYEELLGAINFSRDFTIEALKTGKKQTVCELLENNIYSFPKPHPLDIDLERGYCETKQEKR